MRKRQGMQDLQGLCITIVIFVLVTVGDKGRTLHRVANKLLHTELLHRKKNKSSFEWFMQVQWFTNPKYILDIHL